MCKGDLDGTQFKNGGCRVGGGRFPEKCIGYPSNKANFLAVLEG